MASQLMLLEAMEENLHGHITFIPRHRPGMVVDDREDLLLVDSGLPNDGFNKVARARLAGDTADCRIREAVGYFREAGRPFTWQVGPCSRPLELERRLEAHGLRAAAAAAVMLAEMERLPVEAETPGGPEVRRVRSVADLAAFCTVVSEGWDPQDPSVGVYYGGSAPLLLEEECPLRLFVGWGDGQAAGAGELYVSGSVGGIYRVTRLERFGGRGVRAAMARAALREARRLGLARALIEAPEGEQGMYERLGFAPACRVTEFQ